MVSDSASLSDRKLRRALATGEPVRSITQLLAQGGPLMPEAGLRQSQVDSRVLWALCSTNETMTARNRWLHDVVERVTPLPGELRVRLTEDAAGPVLGRLLPRAVAGRARGVPGLRLTGVDRDRVHLAVPGQGTSTLAAVRLSGVRKATWERHLDAIDAEGGEQFWKSGSRWVSSEARELRPVPRVQARVLSEVLRRVALWRESRWLIPHIDGEMVGFTWFEGPSARAVFELLTDSHVGIDGVTVWYSDQQTEGPRTLRVGPWVGLGERRPASAEAVAEIKAGRQRTRPPKAPRPEHWNRAAMRRALVALDFVAVLGLLRDDGYPVGAVAHIAGWSEPRLRAVRDGRHTLDRDEVNELARKLGIPHDFIGETGGDTLCSIGVSREVIAFLRMVSARSSPTEKRA